MKRNGKPRHFDVMVPSTPDHVALGIAIDERFPVLCKQFAEVTGNELMFPESMKNDVLRWRQLRVRHKFGDCRHTEAELKSMHAIAQWTVTVHDEICGQPVSNPLQWGFDG